ncbi:hypothetical protein CR513_26204, partial [Mucuna pruriens]
MHVHVFAAQKLESMSDEEWDFEHQQFKEDTFLSDHLNEFQGVIDQISGMGIKFEDEILGLLLLNSLPKSWETFKVFITNSTSNGVVSLQMEKGSVLNEDMRRKTKGFSSQSEENKNKKGKSKEKDDDCVTTATGDDLVILRDFESVNFVSDESMWIIDNGVLHCMLHQGMSSLHLTLQVDFGVLKMGNDGVTKVIGVADVCLQTNTRMQLWLRGVKHVLDVRFNLIFVHMLDDDGYDNHFGHRKWKLTKGNLVVARGEKIYKLYWTKALVGKDSVNAMDMEASLWHRRLSHISEKGLNCLAKKDMLLGLKNAELEKCSHCMAGKQTRVSFKKHPPSRKSELLELTKDQVLEKFKQFQALVERQSGKKVKCIRSDNGGEYCGPFDVYCKQQGIRHEKTPPKTPQLNGLVERMNRTLIKRVRCMLSEARLPKHLWGETLYTAVHVINLSPAVALNTEVSDKIWFGNDVKYDHLRVFDCKAFVHVIKDERSKLDMKTRQCIFIGYGHDEYGYRMYDPVDKKLVRSRDVQFMEDETIEDTDKNGEQHNYVGDQQLGDGFDVPLDDDVEEEQEMSQDENLSDALEPPPVQLRRSNRQRQSSTRYTSDEYVTLTDGEELECYQESMESEERQKAWQSKLQKCVALSTTKAELDFVQNEH